VPETWSPAGVSAYQLPLRHEVRKIARGHRV